MHVSIRVISLFTLAALGCGASAPSRFPLGFDFGTAIAGFQVEMGCPTTAPAECEDRNADWYQYITAPEILADRIPLSLNGDPPSAGPGFYELFPQDLDRAQQELKNNALRTSIEWSRIFPTSTVGIAATGTADEKFAALRAVASPQALTYYHSLLAAMKARGLKPLITLNHYTLPTWIHDTVACHQNLATCTRRGWVDADPIVPEIAKFAGFVAREFGGEVDLWATLNEPFTAVVVAGYILQTPTRTNPPGVMLAVSEARQATRNMIEAHARMYDAVKQNDTVDIDGDGASALVGLVYNITVAQPPDPGNALDVTGARNLNYLFNELFLDGVINGQIDAAFDGVQASPRADLVGRMDYLGINYYNRLLAQGLPSSLLEVVSPLLTADVLTGTFDYNYPRGIYEAVRYVRGLYPTLPLYITETGFEDPADTGVQTRWLVETLGWVQRAIDEGAPIRGYYFWTLMDNYEWNHGLDIRLGLYAVDKTDVSKTRRARSPVAAYARIAAAGAIPADLAAAYPLRN